MRGKVEFFNNVRGWGKIVSEGGEAFFVHHRDIIDKRFFPSGDIEKFRTLKCGQSVSFSVAESNLPMNVAKDVTINND